MRRLRYTAAATILASGLFMSGCASRIQFPVSSRYSPTTLTLVGDLYRPDGSARLPAVVLLAPCGGVTQHMGDWAGWLKRQGYVVLIADSFSPRGSTNACRGESPRVPDVARDALAALSYLTTLTFVDGERVAVMGWSHGGGAALAVSRLSRLDYEFADRPAFRAAVAFYPPCEFLDVNTQTSTLILLAGRDDWTPPAQCMAAAGERLVSWKVYPNAYHAFDQPAPMRTYLGHVMAYDGPATDASQQEVRAFLARQLQDKR
jgi:dienelactone hydrolase